MLPPFDIDGGLPLIVARGVAVAALLSVFGTLVFRECVAAPTFGCMPAEIAVATRRNLLRMTQAGTAVALLGMLAWLAVEAADLSDATSAASLLAAVAAVLAQTDFGHLVALQIAALLALALVVGRRDHRTRQRIALALAAIAVALQAGHSHAASMYAGPSWLLVADIAHLLGAGAWLGGLLPLLLVVRTAPPRAGAIAARWFSPLGKICLVALTASALLQGIVLVETIPGLVGTAYGWMVLVKASLFGVLFALAVINRYRLAPALLRGDPSAARRALVRSVAVQTGFGLAIVVAAALLSSLPPAMHEQPLWPFADRFTLETIGEDSDLRNEVLGAVLALSGAAVLLVIAVLLRRRPRWASVAGAAAIAWFAIPHLDLLFVPAYPTSFYHSPTAFAATSIVQGAALYPTHCAMCHGTEGRGDGPLAKGLPEPPADLTAAHLWMHEDGELFWWLAHGMAAPDGSLAMPGFAASLSDDDRWHLIDAIRAHNAGLVFHATGEWTPPLAAPGLQARCADGRTVDLADLKGGFVRLVLGMATPSAGVTTILATTDPAAQPMPGLCIAEDAALVQGYAIVSGVPATGLAGAQFLIDGAGWLRAMQRPDAQPSWNDPAALASEILALTSHPIAAGGSHAGMEM